ncbi:MAG: hypothetical protein FWE37_01050 [Spirochaetaceae bacterium]|nr:hypothetical protein [Spirochaetaceae bacterium]
MFKQIVLVLFLLNMSWLYGQQQQYIVSQINFVIEGGLMGGNTSEQALLARLARTEGRQDAANQLYVGRTFTSLNDLNGRINHWQWVLNGLNAFRSAAITSQITGQTDSQGRIMVQITIMAIEDGNMLLLPYPRIDSNTGLTFGLRLRHFNFLGLLRSLEWDFNYVNNSDGRQFNSDIRYHIPIIAFNRLFTLSFNAGGNFYPENPETGSNDLKHDSRIAAGGIGLDTWWQLSQNIRLNTFVRQQVRVNATAIDDSFPEATDPYFLTTTVGLTIPVPLWQTPIGHIWYTFNSGLNMNYRLEDSIQDSRAGYVPWANNRLSIWNVQNMGNFRHGFHANAGINTSVDSSKARRFGLWGEERDGSPEQYAWNVVIDATFTGFTRLSEQLGISGRIGFNYSIFRDRQDGDENLGRFARGIRDDRIIGDMLFFWNLTLINNVFLWQFSGIGELHGHITYDGMLVRNYRADWQKPYNALGLELVYYPAFSNNFRIRASIAADIEGIINNSNIFGEIYRPEANPPRGVGGSQFEMFFGLELHY